MDHNEEFDEALAEIIDESPASHLLSVPGVYEVLAEHFNNDVLAKIEENRATKPRRRPKRR